MNTLRWPDLLVIALYFGLVGVIGLRFANRQTSTATYFTARGTIPFWAMGLSIFATVISSITFIAYPGAAYAGDWNLLVPGFMAILVLLGGGWVLVSFFRHSVGLSAYEYFEKRFGGGARAYSALAFTAGHFSKMGFVLFTITTAICGMTGWDRFEVIAGVGLVTVLYTILGGIEAVIWTEVLQGIVKLTGLVLVVCFLLRIMPGGPAAAFKLAAEHHKMSLGNFDGHLTSNGNFWAMLIYGGFWYLQKYATDQTLVQRYLIARSDREALKGVALGAVLCVPAWTAFMLVGTLLWAYYQLAGAVLPAHLFDAGGKVIGDRVFPYFLTTQIPAGLAGILIAALFSAAMSSMASDLNCLAAVGVEDGFRKLYPNANDRQRLVAGKVIVLACGGLAVLAGMFIASKGEGALTLYYAATAILSAGLAGMFLLAFLSRRTNRQGLWVGLTAALVFTAWATLTGGKYRMLNLGWNYAWPDVLIGVIAHLLVLVVGYAASWGFPPEKELQTEWTIWGWLAERRGQLEGQSLTPVLSD